MSLKRSSFQVSTQRAKVRRMVQHRFRDISQALRASAPVMERKCAKYANIVLQLRSSSSHRLILSV